MTKLGGYLLQLTAFLYCFFAATQASAISLNDYPKLAVIADEMVVDGIYTRPEIESLFAKAEVQQSVLNAMQNPAEYKLTWGKYRKIFIQPDRIEAAVDFWREYEPHLQRAEAEYGVPASMILAILGVESKYGVFKGSHKVLDSLVSLVTGFPRRSDFFAGELRHFLVLTKENQMDAANILGSYAGAVGYPQFISSSYRAYAVDFSGDGKTDLINQPIDAIGSIANYFVKNGWLKGQPVTSPAYELVPDSIDERANRQRKLQYTAASLRSLGAPIGSSVPDTEELNVLMLDASEEVTETEDGFYIVRAGDTACQIAERHSMTCQSLFQLNNLDSQGTIFRDQKLKVSASNSLSTATTNATTNSNTNGWKIAASAQPIPNGGPQPRYFFTHENFYVITRYNQSVLYAMAVHDLSVAVDLEKRRQDDRTNSAAVSDFNRAYIPQ